MSYERLDLTKKQRADCLGTAGKQIEQVLKRTFPAHYYEMIESFIEGFEADTKKLIDDIEEHWETHPETAKTQAK